MALSPEVWAAVEAEYGPMPQRGQRIRCHLKDGDVLTGTVALVWLAMDEPCINLDYLGACIKVFPGLGDRWEPA